MTDNEKARASAFADSIRTSAPKQAAAIDDALAAGLSVKIGIRYRLEKFDGEYKPGMEPVEVIDGHDNI